MYETLAFMVYFLMIVVYTIVLIEKINIRYGIFLSISMLIFGYIIKYIITTFDNLNINIISGLIFGILAIAIGFIISAYSFKIGLIWRYFFINNEPYKPALIDLALIKLKSSNLEDKKMALKQINQFYKDDKAFYGLCDCIKSENDLKIKNIYIKYICNMTKKRENALKNHP
jgi:hypothetical protein